MASQTLRSQLQNLVARYNQLEGQGNPKTSYIYRLIRAACQKAAMAGKFSWEYTSDELDVRGDVLTYLDTVDGLTVQADTNQGFTYSYTFSWPVV